MTQFSSQAALIDNYIDSNAATTNNGTSAAIAVGEHNSITSVRRTLIKWDLSSIPSNVVIDAATLSIWTDTDLSDNARDFKIYRCLRAWTETGSTWNNWSAGNAWTTAGAGSDGNDTDLTNVWATCNFSASEPAGTQKDFIFSALGLSELTKFINGTYTNNGWLIKADTENADLYNLRSREYGTAGNRPLLVIDYHVGYVITPKILFIS